MPHRLKEILTRLVTTRVAWPLLLSIALLCMVSVLTLSNYFPTYAKTQQLHIVLGLTLLLTVMLPNYQWLGRFSFPALGIVILMLAGVLLTPDIKGARRWFALPGFQLQPSELAKFTFVVALAWYLRHRRNCRELTGLVGPFLIMLVPMGLILIEPDLGTSLLFPPTLYAMLIAAGARIRHLVIITVIALLVMPGFWPLLRPYQKDRIASIALRLTGNASAYDRQHNDYQQRQSELALAFGGWAGPSQDSHDNIQKGVINALPEAHTDFIFAIIGAQWGLIGCLLVLVLYLCFYGASFEIAGSMKEPFGRLLAVGIASMILFQALINMAMTIGLCPVVGIALPFLSYGGSSLVTNMIAAGILLSISVRRTTQMLNPTFAMSQS